jgi:hypothetical protein
MIKQGQLGLRGHWGFTDPPILSSGMIASIVAVHQNQAMHQNRSYLIQ